MSRRRHDLAFRRHPLRADDIGASERRFYQKITDIYATSLDYDPTNEASINFFKTVQNKMHWAITKQTAAENRKTRNKVRTSETIQPKIRATS